MQSQEGLQLETKMINEFIKCEIFENLNENVFGSAFIVAKGVSMDYCRHLKQHCVSLDPNILSILVL